MSKIIPFQPEKKDLTASEDLKRIAEEEEISKFVLVYFDKEGLATFEHFGMSSEAVCWSAQLLNRKAWGD